MFVTRAMDGTVDGVYTCRQSFATEELPDNHADIAAFKAAVIAAKEKK